MFWSACVIYPVCMVNFLQLSDVRAYKKSLMLSNEIWNIATSWKPIARFTVGEQCIRAVDSISANIAEGFGRFHKKDKIKFYYYSRGSVYESLDWIQKSFTRDLLSRELYEKYISDLRYLILAINALIKLTKSKLSI